MNKKNKIQIMELKEKTAELEEKIKILNFKVNNPLGFEINLYMYNGYYLKYINNFNEIKEIKLSSFDYNDYKILKDKKGDIIIEEIKCNLYNKTKIQYKFDKDREILIQIKEEIINE